MAFPAVVGRNVYDGLSDTSHAINIGSPADGTLVVIIARVTTTTTISWPAGWTLLVDNDQTDGANDATCIAYRLCDGTEGATVTVTTAITGKVSAVAYEITGAANPATQPPEVSTVATGTSATPDPSSLSPTGGAKDYLWLWLGAWEGEQTSPPTGNPTNYTNPTGGGQSTAGTVVNNCRVAVAERNLNASSEDPPSWTIDAADDWSAWTMAVHPAGASTQNLTGALFTSAPTFNTGVVSTGAVALTGTLFTKAPTFNTGAVTATYALTGTLFQNTSTFFTGTVTPGAVDLTGTLFSSAPSFFAGEVTNEGGTQTLDGVLFQQAPTFPQGTVTASYDLDGILFQSTPIFNVGTVAASYDLDGTLFVNTPTFFQGEVAASYDLTGTLFTNAPTFFAGEVAPGEVTLSGVLFQNTPVFEQGVLSQEGGPIFLVGTLFQNTPTFPQGTVTPGGVSLTGVLFQSTPTFNAGDVTSTRDLAGVLFQQAPTFFQGDVSLRGLAGELFVSAPVFFVGTITQPPDVSTNWPVSTPAPWPGTDSIGWPVSKESEWQGV